MNEPVNTPDRFDADPRRYAAYLETAEGRLRLDLAWNYLAEALREAELRPSGRALDLGGGPGALAQRLARAGWQVALVDLSAGMLRLAEESARGAGLAQRMEFYHADAAAGGRLFAPASFDLILCHNVIEYVAHPAELFQQIARLLKPRGLLSVLARNRAGEALRAAIKTGDLDAAERALEARAVRESLYGGEATLFDPSALNALACEAGLEPVALRGVRVSADYLPAALLATEDGYRRVMNFDERLGRRAEMVAVARYLQLFARLR